MFFTKDHTDFFTMNIQSDFTINQKYMFFNNFYQVWYAELPSAESQASIQFKRINLLVNHSEHQTQILKILAGPDCNRVAISIKQSPRSNCVIIWDLGKDKEIHSFDVSTDAKVYFDVRGDSYIVDSNAIINCK